MSNRWFDPNKDLKESFRKASQSAKDGRGLWKPQPVTVSRKTYDYLVSIHGEKRTNEVLGRYPSQGASA